MADIRLDLSLRQEQKLSTQMVQTMETIAMPAQELNEKIRKEAETNPVLVIKDRSPSYSEFASRYSSATDRRESYSDSSYGEDSDGQQGSWIEGMVSSRESLSEHLLSQLWESDAEKPVLAAASVIITAMDGNGFLPSPPEELLPPESRHNIGGKVPVLFPEAASCHFLQNRFPLLLIEASEKWPGSVTAAFCEPTVIPWGRRRRASRSSGPCRPARIWRRC